MNKYLLLVPFFLLLSHASQAQQDNRQTIAFKYDTFYIDKNDSIVATIGDSLTGIIKYRTGDHYCMVHADSGFITRHTVLFADGKKRHESYYRNGKLSGPDLEWNENGLVIYSGHYLNGYADSIWTWYYNDGIKETQGRFLYDTTALIPGLEITFRYQDVQDSIASLTSMYARQSPPHGNWYFYNTLGERTRTLTFDKGVLKSIETGGGQFNEDNYHRLIKENNALRAEISSLKKKPMPTRNPTKRPKKKATHHR